MSHIVVIPARYKSSRLPGKPLIKIQGKEMLLRTYEQCLKVEKKTNIIIATDDDQIENFCINNYLPVIKTSSECETGTDRVAEVAKIIKRDHYINVQGDEPVFNPNDLTLLINSINSYPALVLNGYTEISTEKDFFSSHTPKVVFNSDNNLLYMSRAAIPGNKDQRFNIGFRQICLYAFPRDILMQNFSPNSNPKRDLERIEDIEILRFIENGIPVKMLAMSNQSIPVDTPEDLDRVNQYLQDLRG